MVVISIIGILAVIAVPSYRGHVIETHINNALTTASSAQTAVLRTYSQTGQLPCCGACTSRQPCRTNSPISTNNPSPQVERVFYWTPVGGVNAEKQGAIIIVLKNLGSNIPTSRIALSIDPNSLQSGVPIWQCGVLSDSSQLMPYMPSRCQQTFNITIE